MAWLDERVWCHPKFTDLTDAAAWTWTKGIAYSSGMATAGALTAGQVRIIGATEAVRTELVAAGLWESQDDGSVVIHDWDLHNGKRDKRRADDRMRKRNLRLSAGQSAGQSAGASAGTAHVEGSEGSEGSDKKNLRGAVAPVLGAQALVAHLVTEAVRLNVTLPERSKGHAASGIKALLNDGMPEPILRRAITQVLERGRPVAALTDIARELQATGPPDESQRPTTGTYARLPRYG